MRLQSDFVTLCYLHFAYIFTFCTKPTESKLPEQKKIEKIFTSKFSPNTHTTYNFLLHNFLLFIYVYVLNHL